MLLWLLWPLLLYCSCCSCTCSCRVCPISFFFGQSGHSALHMAASFGNEAILKFFLQLDGINLNVRNELGFTPLMFAADRGFNECVHALLQAGANSALKNQDGLTALDLARSNHHSETVIIFEGRSHINFVQKHRLFSLSRLVSPLTLFCRARAIACYTAEHQACRA
eukprot:m.59701 g.59701  ORF g.59701 m.59701 type:complete len:167 (+) comp49268_c0_seq10:111-611(+)